jgi:hypothetical protein
VYRGSGLGRSCETVPWKSQIPDRRFPDRYKCVGSKRQKQGQVSSENRHIGTWRLKFQLIDIVSSDFPIGRNPEREREREGSQRLTRIGIQGFTGHKRVTTEFVKSRIPISRFEKEVSGELLWVEKF